MSEGYRPEIDALRAVAVLPVVMFHADVPGFSGGFVGVDVFFVISGFLITSILAADMAEGRFSVAGFYERRVRRIFPALFVMLAASCLAATALLLPDEMDDFGRSLAASAAFVSNIFFMGETGYFVAAAETKPLLHTWSLAIEEQFYIFFPLYLAAVGRWTPRWLLPLTGAALVASLALCIAMTHPQNDAAFFYTPARIWELLAGSMLALAPLRLPGWLAAAGLGMIAAAVFGFDPRTPFPGAAAALPVAGTLMVLAGTAGRRSLAGAALSLGPVRFVGLISYSLYLWHWPLLVFTQYFLIRELTVPEKAILLAVSFLVAAASWRYIEMPFRGSRGLLPRKALFATAGAASLLFIAIATAGHFYRSGSPGAQALAAPARVLPHQHCLNREISKILAGDLCMLGAGGQARPTFLLWGDSHAGALAPAIDRIAGRQGRTGLFAGQAGCLPFRGVERHDRHDLRCREFNDAVERLLEQNREIRTVFLVARWAMYTEGSRTEDATGATVLIAPGKVEENALAFQKGLEQTLSALAGGGREVVFVTQVPEIGWDVPAIVARSRAFGRRPPEPPSLEAYRARQKTVTDIVRDISQRYPLRLVDVSRPLCPHSTCLIERGGQFLYLDSNHLSAHGNEFVANAFAGVM